MELKQMELKEKLVDLRKEKGLSQAELAEAINVSRQAISQVGGRDGNTVGRQPHVA